MPLKPKQLDFCKVVLEFDEKNDMGIGRQTNFFQLKDLNKGFVIKPSNRKPIKSIKISLYKSKLETKKEK